MEGEFICPCFCQQEQTGHPLVLSDRVRQHAVNPHYKRTQLSLTQRKCGFIKVIITTIISILLHNW